MQIVIFNVSQIKSHKSYNYKLFQNTNKRANTIIPIFERTINM